MSLHPVVNSFGVARLIVVILALVVAASNGHRLIISDANAQSGSTVSVLAFGAIGNGSANDRPAIQAAIDAQAANGGGTVQIPYRATCSNGNGVCNTFLSGNLVLKSGVTLRIDVNATLRQSEYAGQSGGRNDYTYLPVLSKYPGTALQWDLSALVNAPLVYATNASDVTITGGGTIQLGAGGSTKPYLVPIGFVRVDGFTVENLHILGSHVYNIVIIRGKHGIISGNDIVTANEGETDGINLTNSQHIAVSGNTILNGDDGIYVVASYNDPRGGNGRWWSTADPQPSTDITISGNTTTTYGGNGRGLTLIPWGRTAPDLRDVEISDVHFLNNTIYSDWGFQCWCDNPFYGQQPFVVNTNVPENNTDASPMKNIRFSGNSYNNRPGGGSHVERISPQTVTDLEADWGGGASSSVFLNAGFERTGDAYWSTSGANPANVGAYGSGSVGQSGQWYGYLQNANQGYQAIGQGIALYAGNTYTVRIRAQTSGQTFQFYVWNACTNSFAARTTFSNTTWQTQTITVPITATCGHYHIGVDNNAPGIIYQASNWVRVDDFSVVRVSGTAGEPPVVIYNNPEVVYAGTWNESLGISGDIAAGHKWTKSTSASASIPFVGSRAKLIAVTDSNCGKANVYLDGTLVGTADFYSPTGAYQKVVFDTGPIAYGMHTLKVVPNGTKNAAATDTYITFNAVQPE